MCPLPPTESWHGKRRREPLAAADCDTRPQCSVFSGDTILPDWTPKCAFLVRFAAGFESGPHLEAADTGTLAPARDGVARSSSQPCGVRGESHMEHITPRVSCLYVQTLHDHANRPIVPECAKRNSANGNVATVHAVDEQTRTSIGIAEYGRLGTRHSVAELRTSPDGSRRSSEWYRCVLKYANSSDIGIHGTYQRRTANRQFSSSGEIPALASTTREGRLRSGRGIGTNRHTKIKNNKPAT